MAHIRRYAGLPGFFVPDEGEHVLVARSPAGPFCRAYVTRVRRASRQKVRVDFVWAESAEHTPSGSGITEGAKGNVYLYEDDVVPLVRRLPDKPPPAATA